MTDSRNRGLAVGKARTPKGFYIHLGVFVLVNAGLFTMNSIRQPDRMWSYWVLLGWGAGVLLHAAKVFSCGACKNREDRKNNTLVKDANPESNTRPQPSARAK